MAYVAAGRYDGFFQNNLIFGILQLELLMVEEAGGIINKINKSNTKNIRCYRLKF